jgi:hypothetical protein
MAGQRMENALSECSESMGNHTNSSVTAGAVSMHGAE